MRLLFLIIGLISAFIAIILAVLPLSNFAFFPAILAFVFGLLAFFKSKKDGKPLHTIHLVFLLTIISLALATYKSVMTNAEVGNTEVLEQREEQLLEESIDELEDIDISE